MASTRDRALEAAVDLLGRQGLRALTHVRVDEHAGLPRGSTSNSFRTRAALLDGVVAWVAERELADTASGIDLSTLTADQLVDAFCALLEAQTGPFGTRTLARYVLFLESASHPALRAPMVANRHSFEELATAMMTSLGAPDPQTAARTLMACGEGLILHRLTVDPELPLRPSVALLVRACLAA
jgi:DNA-binding transcriptional regulator YbjK